MNASDDRGDQRQNLGTLERAATVSIDGGRLVRTTTTSSRPKAIAATLFILPSTKTWNQNGDSGERLRWDTCQLRKPNNGGSGAVERNNKGPHAPLSAETRRAGGDEHLRPTRRCGQPEERRKECTTEIAVQAKIPKRCRSLRQGTEQGAQQGADNLFLPRSNFPQPQGVRLIDAAGVPVA